LAAAPEDRQWRIGSTFDIYLGNEKSCQAAKPCIGVNDAVCAHAIDRPGNKMKKPGHGPGLVFSACGRRYF
jgi:hypothetical protein